MDENQVAPLENSLVVGLVVLLQRMVFIFRIGNQQKWCSTLFLKDLK